MIKTRTQPHTRATTLARLPHAITALALVAIGMIVVSSSSAFAQGTVTGAATTTPGGWLFAAGLDSRSCEGLPAGADTDEIIVAAEQSGAIQLVGTTAASITSYTPGASTETPVVGEIDTTTAEVAQGLSAVDDFGRFSNGDDDTANADIGTDGSVEVTISGPQVVVADGIVATGVLGTGLDGLDGAEIFIVEDAELSGFTVELTNDAGTTVTLTTTDFEINPGTRDGADDIVLAIDLDSLRGWSGSLSTIRVTDTGTVQATVESCTSQGLVDTSVEIDAILVKKTDPFQPTPAISLTTSTNGEDANTAPGPQIEVGEPVNWTYTVTNTGNVELTSIVVTDNIVTGIDCGNGSNEIASLAVGRSATCTLTGTAAAGSYTNIGSVTANGVGTTLTASATDPSNYTGFIQANASIGDTVWLDLDGSGTQNSGEPGIEGVTVVLSGPSSGQVVTDTAGNYSFDGLLPGSYTISVDASTLNLPAGSVPTFDLNGAIDGSSTENLTAGETTVMHDFGYSFPGTVTIQTSTNGADADTAPGVTVTVGEPISWSYTVQNSGPTPLTAVTVTDSQGATVDCGNGTPTIDALPAGQTVSCTATGTAIEGSFLTVGSVTAVSPGGDQPSASDPTNYTGVPRPTANVGDRVFVDINGDGILNTGEIGLAGITMTLSGPGGTQQAITGANGGYLFSDLAAGDYSITAGSVPAGFILTADPDGGNDGTAAFTVDGAGTNVLTIDFGFQPDASLTIEKATNGSDADAAPGADIIEGATVTWTYTVRNTGTAQLEAVTVTDDQETGIDCGTGSNVIGFLAPGASVTCSFAASATLGAYENTGSVMADVTQANLTVGATDQSHYTGITDPAGSIGDRIWLDANRNGLQDSGESGAAGVTVRLWSVDASGTPTGAILQEVTSATLGGYRFVGVAPGDYRLQIVPLVDQVITVANVGTNDALDSDFDVLTGLSDVVTLGSGGTINSVDAGLTIAPASIRGQVWNDASEDGLRVSEAGLSTVTVNLRAVGAAGAAGAILDTLVTGANGLYAFTNLEPSLDYFIEVVAPAGYSVSPQLVGSDPTIDSDIGANGLAAVTALSPGESRSAIDAGLFEPVVIPPTATPTATPVVVPPTATATSTPVVVPPTATATSTPVVVPPTATATSTPVVVPPTATATSTPVVVPPTATATSTPVVVPPTATATSTPVVVPPTATATSTPTVGRITPTPTATSTRVTPTPTSTTVVMVTSTPTATVVIAPTPTPTPTLQRVTPTPMATATPTATSVPATATRVPATPTSTATPTPTSVPATATRVPVTATPTTTSVPATATSTATPVPTPAPEQIVLDELELVSGIIVVPLLDVLPTSSAVRVLDEGTGAPIEAGDVVGYDLEIVSLTTGLSVDSTINLPELPELTVGGADVPQVLSDALIGLPLGSVLAVVYPLGMADLPADLDPTDAYVVVIFVSESDAATPTPTTTPTPTATRVPATATATAVPATATATATPTAVPATATSTATPTATATATPTATATATPTATATATPTATPVPEPDTVGISGSVFGDLNNNGSLDTGETGEEGVVIAVWTVSASGALQTRVGIATTDANGGYEVLGLRTGVSYAIVAVPNSNSVISNDGPDNPVVDRTGVSAAFTLETDEPVRSVSIGVTAPARAATPTAVPSTPTPTAVPRATSVVTTVTSTPVPNNVLGATVTAPTATPVPSGTAIAITGSNAGPLALVALAMMIAGALFVGFGRRSRHRS